MDKPPKDRLFKARPLEVEEVEIGGRFEEITLPKPYYDHAGITIYHGDCREILPLLAKVDLVLTDPPYGAGYAANPIVGKGKPKSNHPPQSWDDNPIDDILQISRQGEEAVVWGGNYYNLPASRGWLVWYKRDSPPSMADCELAWTSKDMNTRLFDWTISSVNASRVGHPTQKPVELMRWSLGFFPHAHTTIDPFMGSGTTLRAAKDLGRKAIGIEIDERYCEIAAKRMAQEVLKW